MKYAGNVKWLEFLGKKKKRLDRCGEQLNRKRRLEGETSEGEVQRGDGCVVG